MLSDAQPDRATPGGETVISPVIRPDTAWTLNRGPAQSAFFADLAADHTPRSILAKIKGSTEGLLDVGCAEGDGTLTFADRVGLAQGITGIDISQEHIDVATALYGSRATFFREGLMDPDGHRKGYGHVFCSNLLEHLARPWHGLQQLLARSTRFTWILVPFQEDQLLPAGPFNGEGDSYPGHVNRFGFFPACLRGHLLVQQVVIDTRGSGFWDGDQLMAIYRKTRD